MITNLTVTQCTSSAATFMDGVFLGTFTLTALILWAIKTKYKKKDTK
jgi:hypothetical protein